MRSRSAPSQPADPRRSSATSSQMTSDDHLQWHDGRPREQQWPLSPSAPAATSKSGRWPANSGNTTATFNNSSYSGTTSRNGNYGLQTSSLSSNQPGRTMNMNGAFARTGQYPNYQAGTFIGRTVRTIRPAAPSAGQKAGTCGRRHWRHAAYAPEASASADDRRDEVGDGGNVVAPEPRQVVRRPA